MKKLSVILAGAAVGVALIVILAVSISACSSTRAASSQPSEAEKAKMEMISTMLQSKLYKVDFTQAYPASEGMFMLRNPYFISIIGDRVESFLPYMGRTYVLPADGGEGLRFTAPVTGYKMTTDKRGKYKISFDARTAEDNYTFELEVDPMGASHLDIYARRKQDISFGGQIDMDPEFEAVRIE